ncbi:MAG TPA: fumarate reductase subunit FrdD [Usitatibacter sp.]|jgi:fumarate reductase subunit D|nr:fumarate reductase subunit FrdD [Usitatibacter sp.]
MSRRSSQPFYWALFGAGGMLSALVGAMMVFTTGLALPLGIGPGARLSTYEGASAIVRSLPAKLFLFAVVSLFLWHAAHRMYHTVHDFGIRPGAIAWTCCYGVALLGTLVALVALFAAGF